MSEDRRYLDLAARLAARAEGDVEPNPLVGCVLVRDGRVIGMGHHRRFGGPHAEVEAIAAAREAGEDPQGSTAYVTLEPCAHHGKQPPCTQALVEAGVARVVCARRDPHPDSAGGSDELRRRGIEVVFPEASETAVRLTDPFIKFTTVGLPWVIVKWAQSVDGRVATRTGESRWISGIRARRRVHRLRARVDAILTGIGTVEADDPLLTARGVRRVRRVARRVVLDPDLRTPIDSTLVRTTDVAPLTVACSEAAAIDEARWEERRRLDGRGVEVVTLPPTAKGLDVRALLRHLAAVHQVTRVLVEAGPRLVGTLLEEDLVDETLVFIAPLLFGDDRARGVARGRAMERLDQARRFRLIRARQLGPDVELRYRRDRTSAEEGA